jgi:hypothetical protein
VVISAAGEVIFDGDGGFSAASVRGAAFGG